MITNIKTPFRQTAAYGCGHHALANLYNNSAFLDCIVPGKGERVWDLNNSLAKIDPLVYLDVYMLTNPGVDVQNRITDASLFKFVMTEEERQRARDLGEVRPFIVTIRGAKLDHCILILQDVADEDFYVVDSLKEHIQVYKVDEFLTALYVFGIETFSLIENPDGCVVWYKSSLTHIFN